MSDSEDDMPMIARRRPADGPVIAAAALATKPAAPAPATATATAPPATLNNKPAMKPEPNTVAAPVNVEQKHKIEEEKHVKHAAAATPKQGAHNQPAPVKQEAKPDDSSDDDDEDVPLNVLQHRKQAGTNHINGKPGSSKAPAADGSNHVVKQEAKQAAKPAAATQRRSSDGGSKKGPAAAAAAADNGKPAADKKQPAKKAPASAAKKVQANGAAGAKEVRVKKEFDLPGQSRETPDETDPLRKFYSSLLQENANSAMARKWCVMHGLLSAEDAAEWVKDNKGSRAGPLTPSKPAAASRAAGAKRPAAAVVKKAPAAKRAAKGDGTKPKAKATTAARPKKRAQKEKMDWDDDDDDDDDEPAAADSSGGDADLSSDDDVPLAQRGKGKAKAG